MVWILACVLCIGTLVGCASPNTITIEAHGRTIIAHDGAPIATFEILDQGRPDREPRALLFFIQGSDYQSLQHIMPQLAGATLMGVRTIIAERRGIGIDGSIDEAAAIYGSTLSQRITDHQLVIDWYCKRQDADLPIILIGSSEGGTVAGAIAAREQRITHLVLVGSGGWPQAKELKHMLEEDGRGFGVRTMAEFESQLEAIHQDPDSISMWAGHPYRRWSSFLWYDPMVDLQSLSIPVLVMHGALDDAVPVESARSIRDRFVDREPSKTDESGPVVSYVEFPELDHSFFDQKRNVSGFPMLEIELADFFHQHGLIDEHERDYLTNRIRSAHPELFSPKR